MNIKLPEIIQSHKLVIMPLLASLFAILLAFFIVVPQTYKIISQIKEIDSSKQRVASLNLKSSKLASLNLEEYKNKLNKTLIVLPFNKEVPQALLSLQLLANSLNIEIKNYGASGISPTARSGSQEKDSFTISLELEGSYDSLKSFINQIDTLPRTFSLRGVNFTSTKEGDRFSSEMSIAAFFSPEQNLLGSVDEEVTGLTIQEESMLDDIEEVTKSIPVVNEKSLDLPRGKSNPFE